MEELNKELRQCKLQQFILQSGASPHADSPDLPPDLPPLHDVYLNNAGIIEQEGHCTSSDCENRKQ